MRRRISIIALALFTLTASAFGQNAQQGGRGRGAQGAASGRYIDATPINFNDNAGWIQMFDGATLKGWDGPTDLWHVENGMIVVRSKADPPTGPTYLLWEGGEPKDFEFKCELRLEGAGADNGVQIPAVEVGE